MKNLTMIREERGLSRSEMAALLNVTLQSYSRYENGKRQPSIETLKKISEILKVDIKLFLDSPDFDSTFDLSIAKHPITGRPVVTIVDCCPKLTGASRKILAKYLSFALSRIDFNEDIRPQIDKALAKERRKLNEF